MASTGPAFAQGTEDDHVLGWQSSAGIAWQRGALGRAVLTSNAWFVTSVLIPLKAIV